MNTLDFPGRDAMIAALDDAVALGDDRSVTDALRKRLCAMIGEKEVQLPECVFEPIADHYARRELYTSPEHGYSVIAMTWGPGQGTKIHDHSGMWCVEGVWRGRLEITQYELAEHDAERYRFVAAGTIEAGTGSAGSLIPPHEYHTIRNPSDDAVAVSLHIYSGPMTHCAIFKPVGTDHCYERTDRQLGLDPVH